jgi:cytochrome c oxidase assembly protein subunit 15
MPVDRTPRALDDLASRRTVEEFVTRRQIDDPAARRTLGDILTLGFASAAAMWTLGFLCRLPVGGGSGPGRVVVPPVVLLPLMLLCVVKGGAFAGRWTPRGVTGGLLVGLLAGALSLLLVAGALHSGDSGRTLADAALWIPGTLVVCALCGGAGAALGRLWPHPVDPAAWPGAFAMVAAGLTLVLILVGGTVTGFDAGLAVVDWPNTEGYMMFMFPLAKMTGGLYYEHSHRLFGSLTGLTTLVLVVYLYRVEPRRWVRWLALAALGLVIVQGVLGGLRVTGRFTMTTDAGQTAPSLTLAVIHGIVGQVFFAVIVAVATVTQRAWRLAPPPRVSPAAGTERGLAWIVYGLLVVQLVLGALVRHLMSSAAAREGGAVEALLHVHITVAILAAIAALMLGLRAIALQPKQSPLRRFGRLLTTLIGVQLVLGLAAYIAVYGGSAAPGQASGWQVLLTTVHQTMGAALLGNAVMLLLWTYRALTPAVVGGTGVSPVAGTGETPVPPIKRTSSPYHP